MSFEYKARIKLVIDRTGSMASVIGGVKAFAASAHSAVMAGLAAQQKHVDELQVEVITFGDFGCDGHDALTSAGPFILPADEGKLQDQVARISLAGGGDIPENSLEALAFALAGDWPSDGAKRRHAVILMTDAPPHPYGTVNGPGKPGGLPASLDELLAVWRGDKQGFKLDPGAARLYLVVPPGIEAYERWADEKRVAIMPISDVLASPEAAREHIVATMVNSI
jgi:hypothetical protein